MKLSLSLKLLTTLAVLTSMASPAVAQDMSKRDRHQAEKQAKRDQRQAVNQSSQNTRQVQQDFRQTQRAQQQAFEQNRRNANELAKQQDRARELAQRNQARLQQDARKDDRRDDRFDNRWANNNNKWRDNDNRWDDRGRWHSNRQIISYNKAFRNWDSQRDYLKANIRKLNQARALSQLQQSQLNAQMQAAYLAYHNNNWNGGYNWDYYSEPQFLDYLQVNQPSLLDRILGYLGVGGGLGTGNYLYSDNWMSERDQLARNMARIHQLALEGRITPYQEQQLLADLRSEFTLYKNHNWNGGYGWSQYSDPGFVDYLNSNRPSLLTTIRSYLR